MSALRSVEVHFLSCRIYCQKIASAKKPQFWRILSFNSNGCVHIVKKFCTCYPSNIMIPLPYFLTIKIIILLLFERTLSYLMLKGFNGPSRAEKLLKTNDKEHVMHGRYIKISNMRLQWLSLILCCWLHAAIYSCWCIGILYCRRRAEGAMSRLQSTLLFP